MTVVLMLQWRGDIPSLFPFRITRLNLDHRKGGLCKREALLEGQLGEE